MQTKLKWKLDKTESIEQCKAISRHARGLYGVQIFHNVMHWSISWFSHDVTKIQTKKLSLLLSFYFHVILEHLKTFIQTNFRFKRVLCFAIQDAWISGLLCDAVFSWRPGKLLCGLKTLPILEILLSKHSLFQNKINITLIFMSSSSEEFTQ